MNIKIASAVAAALAVSAPAFALDPTGTSGAAVQLTVSGASAARDAMGALMANSICDTGFSFYRANPTANQDFRAYSCTLKTLASLGGASGKTATIYYRAEGGSAWGPAPIATNTQVARLQVNTDCTLNASTVSLPGVAAGVQTYNCPTTGYSLASDTFGAENNLVKDSVDLGVSDEEPKMYGFPNFPTSTVFPTASNSARQALLNTLNAAAIVGFGQTFGIVVNSTGAGQAGNGVTTTVATPFAAFSSSSGTQPVLSRQAIAGIFNGTFTNWNQVPTVTGGTVITSPSSLTIRVCRREQGSGTQVGANQYFLGVPQCGNTLGNFRTDGTGDSDITPATLVNDTDGVIEMGTSADLNTCVATLAGSIGLVVGNAAATGTNYVSINGMGFPTREKAAIGNYDYYYELTFQLNPNLAPGDVLDLANGIITESKPASTAPNVLSVVALPNDVNDPYGQGPFATTQPPVAFATRSGNSCKALTPQ
jgi:hypothetical protein